jgi:hypothetical protein
MKIFFPCTLFLIISIVVLGKVVFPEGGFIRDGTTTVYFQKISQFFIVQSPKQNICGHQGITQLSLKIR